MGDHRSNRRSVGLCLQSLLCEVLGFAVRSRHVQGLVGELEVMIGVMRLSRVVVGLGA